MLNTEKGKNKIEFQIFHFLEVDLNFQDTFTQSVMLNCTQVVLFEQGHFWVCTFPS